MTPREKGLPRLRDRTPPVAVATNVSRPNSLIHCVKNPSCLGRVWRVPGGTAGSGPIPVWPSWAPLILVLPATKADVIASEACQPWCTRPPMLSKVVCALAICKSCTIRSMVTHTSCTAAHNAKTTVKVSRKTIWQMVSDIILHCT